MADAITLTVDEVLEVVIGETKTFDVIARLNGVAQDMTGKIPYFTAKESVNSPAAAIAINGVDHPTQAFPVLPQTGDDLGRLRFVLEPSDTEGLCPADHVFDVWTEQGGERLIIIRPPAPGRPGGVMRVIKALTSFS